SSHRQIRSKNETGYSRVSQALRPKADPGHGKRRLKLIECVPNFSEGRRQEVINSIADAIRSTPGVTLLDVESNPDHNRSVISFVGESGPVKQAALAASGKAIELIDLTKHEGEHPRMGAVDVVPFVPLSGATMDDCVALAKDGGVAYVKALGFELKERGIVQVSMNMTDYHKSQLFKVKELVELFAERYGVQVVSSEIVGLAPMDALVDSAEFYLKLENFSREQVLEKRLFAPSPSSLTDMSLSNFSEEVASKKATPGGGSVSAYMGALAAGLVCMVARITLAKKDTAQDIEQLQEVVRKGEDLRERLLGLVVEDAESFDAVMQAFKLTRDKPDVRRKAIQGATVKAAEV